MAVITRKFDPNKVFTLSTLAREVGVGISAATRWWGRNKHRDDVPQPLFTLDISGKSLNVWDDKHLPELVGAYRAGRASRGLE